MVFQPHHEPTAQRRAKVEYGVLSGPLQPSLIPEENSGFGSVIDRRPVDRKIDIMAVRDGSIRRSNCLASPHSPKARRTAGHRCLVRERKIIALVSMFSMHAEASSLRV